MLLRMLTNFSFMVRVSCTLPKSLSGELYTRQPVVFSALGLVFIFTETTETDGTIEN